MLTDVPWHESQVAVNTKCAEFLCLVINGPLTEQSNDHKPFDISQCCINNTAQVCMLLHICVTSCNEMSLSPQIGSFSVSPNYDIMFFSSEIYPVVNILNYIGGNINRDTVMNDLKSFTIGGK